MAAHTADRFGELVLINHSFEKHADVIHIDAGGRVMNNVFVVVVALILICFLVATADRVA